MVLKRLGPPAVCILLAAAAACPAAGADPGPETGPVERRWGLGWDQGLTARLWLGGVWELAVAAGPEDFLNDGEGFEYDTGYPPDWEESEIGKVTEDRTESGFVRVQGGRLVARRGPLAMVCFTGLQYRWSDGSTRVSHEDALQPDLSYIETTDSDSSTWTLTLGIRPSFVVLGFLTIETAFGLEYRWSETTWAQRREYPDSGRLFVETYASDGNSFDDSGWTGTGSLQFILWF